MASDQRNLDRISTLIGRRPLATLDAEISDCDSSFDSYDVSYSDISDSKESRLFATLFLKVSIVFWASDRQKGPVHKVDQKTIESIFHEIQYCTRHRFHRKSSRTHASDLANSSGGPYTLKKDMFRSSFNDNIQSPITSSIIDSKSFIEGQYYSFYIGIWLGVAFAIVKHLIRTSLNDQVPLHKGPVFGIFTHGLFEIALTDFAMYLGIYVVYFIQVLCSRNVIQWCKTGRTLTSIYELMFLMFWVYFVVCVIIPDQWIGRTFLILHMFVLFMKMHSYAFYNGYLWKILRELQFSESYLERLHNGTAKLPPGFEPNTTNLLTKSIAFCKFELLHQSMMLEKAAKKGTLEMDSQTLCKTYLCFPSNINFWDFFMYTMFPTVLYTLKFARTEKIRWLFVFEKIAAMIGVIFIMLLVAEHGVHQYVMNCLEAKDQTLTLIEKLKMFFVTFMDLAPPLLMEYLLSFYLIWHVILNLIAELTRYADRDFYGHWWALIDWEEFSRLWNKPVHKFLLRHVYRSSISAFSLSKTSSFLLTFIISSVVHELVMYVVFGRVRGYLFLFQMFQLPLIFFHKSRLLREHKTTRNVFCLMGLILAPGLIPALYFVF